MDNLENWWKQSCKGLNPVTSLFFTWQPFDLRADKRSYLPCARNCCVNTEHVTRHKISLKPLNHKYNWLPTHCASSQGSKKRWRKMNQWRSGQRGRRRRSKRRRRRIDGGPTNQGQGVHGGKWRRKRKHEKEKATKAQEKLSPKEEVKPGSEKAKPDARPSSATKAGGVSQPPRNWALLRSPRSDRGYEKDTAKGR